MSIAEAQQTPEEKPIENVIESVPAWWAERVRQAGLPRKWEDWKLALSEPPLPISNARDGLRTASPGAVGEAYLASLDSATRLREGRHYTPTTLVDVLWRELDAVARIEGPVADPACGAGALLLPAVRRFARAARDPEAALRNAPRSISGTDLDPLAVWIGNALLGAELLPLWTRVSARRRGPLPRLLDVGDGLLSGVEQRAVVVLNPPYGRVRLGPKERARWNETLHGHANRYALFLQAAIESTTAGGLVGAVLPTSFLGGAYFQRLRSYITRHAPLVRLVFVDARTGVFTGDVLQETCIAVFRKGGQTADVRCSTLSVNGAVHHRSLPTAPRPASATRPWLLPRAEADAELLAAATLLPDRLSTFGWKASTGPLVWNRHKLQISSSPDRGRIPIVWAADLLEGELRRSPSRDNRRWIALRPDDGFMRLRDPAVLVQRTTALEQPRRLVAGLLTEPVLLAWGGSVVVENHVNVLRCHDPDSPLSPALLYGLLRTRTLDRLFRCVSGSVAVSAYELEALPLPDAETLRAWQRLRQPELEAEVAGFYSDGVSK